MKSWSSPLFSIIGTIMLVINIGQPPKPYFLDFNTESDLTWLKCDAPRVHCIEVNLLI